MPSLYGNVSVGNTIGLYQQSSGTSQVLTNAQSLLSLLSNASTVGFSLTAANTQVQASVQPTGVTSGTYGNASLIPVITVGGDGRVTSISTVTNPTNSYGNANVTALLNGSVTIGNLTVVSGVYWANGQPYTSPQLYGNANVAAYLTTATINTTGNITAANLTTAGNVTAAYVKGDGSLLTNLPVQQGTYSNANVAAYMPVYGGDIRAGTVAATVALTAPTLANNSGGGLTINASGSNLADLGLLASGNVNINPNQGTGSNKGINLNYNTYTNYPFNISNSIYSSGGYYWANNVPYSATVQGLYGDSNVAAYLATHPQAGSYGNANVAAYLPTYVGAIGDQYANIQINTTNIGGDGNIITTGNGVTIQTWNSIHKQNGPSNAIDIIANGANDVLQLTGNSSVTIASGGNILISPPIGLFSTYTGTILTVQGDASVQEIRAGSGGNLTVAKKFTAGNIITTNGVFWANGVSYGSANGSYGNAQVAAYLPVYGGNIAGQITTGTQNYINILNNVNNIIGPANGAIYIDNYGAPGLVVETTQIVALDVPLKVRGADLSVGDSSSGGSFYSYGNITANAGAYFFGDGRFLTNLPVQAGTYSNSNVASYLTTYNGTIGTATGTVTIGGNLVTTSKLTTGNLVTSAGVFWSNGAAYSAGSSFTGDLAGSTLFDSVNGRILANAYPQSDPGTQPPMWQNIKNNPPVYVNGVLQAAAGTAVNGLINQNSYLMQTVGNVGLQSSYQTTNTRFTNGILNYQSIWPVTANVMQTTDRYRHTENILEVNLNGISWASSQSQLNQTVGTQQNFLNIYGNGTLGTAGAVTGIVYLIPEGTALGSGLVANVNYVTGVTGIIQSQNTYGSTNTANVIYARGFLPQVAPASNSVSITNAVGLHTPSGWVTAPNAAGGGGYNSNNGSSGGSGGGGAQYLGTGGAGTAGQGYAAGNAVSGNNSGSGGGGAGGVGDAVNGGVGAPNSITGSSIYYAGGGGGGGDTGGGTGGSGGGGTGGSGGGGTGTNGTAISGGGGGGAGGSTATSGSGGSGVVILSVPTAFYTGTTTGSPTVTTNGSNTVMTFTGSGSYTA